MDQFQIDLRVEELQTAYAAALQNEVVGVSPVTLEGDKEIFVFLGMPGAGKSTLIRKFTQITGAPVYHMGGFARETGQRDEALREKGLLLTGLDQAFLDHTLADEPETVVLDGFPRSVEQADLLTEVARDRGYSLRLIHVVLPESEAVELSLNRQVYRSLQEGKPVDHERFFGKIERAIVNDIAAINHLKAVGVHT